MVGWGGVQNLQAWCASVVEAHGAPDLVVNNAGVTHPRVPGWELAAEQVDALLATNVAAVFSVVRGFVRPMIDRGGPAAIVNISSGKGRSAHPHLAAYCASKWAVEALSKSLVLLTWA